MYAHAPTHICCLFGGLRVVLLLRLNSNIGVTGCHVIAWADFKSMIPQPQLPKCWEYNTRFNLNKCFPVLETEFSM